MLGPPLSHVFPSARPSFPVTLVRDTRHWPRAEVTRGDAGERSVPGCPPSASSRSLLRTATGRVRVSVGSVSLSVRAPTHVRVHTHVQMRPCAPFPRTCLGPAAGAGRAAPPLPCTPHCSPGMRRPRGAGLACRHSDGLTWRCSSRPPALCSRRLTRVSSQPPKRPKNA